jgi:2-(1,2-epoxy-1,2-dihydrophenyl)acetyl-CoA isomerase
VNDILVSRADGVVTVTFNRPEKKNALNGPMWAVLDQVTNEVMANRADRVLVLKGAGADFSSGADLSGGLGSGGGANQMEGESAGQAILHEMRSVGEIVNRLHRLPKPTLAVVDGVCVGVAFGLALACDLVIASDRARFGAVFARRGLALDGGLSWSLPRAVGMRRAKQMAFFGEMVSGPDALACGMINACVPAADLHALGDQWAQRLGSSATIALGLTKRQLDASSAIPMDKAVEDEARSQHIAFTTSDMEEGIKAFLERREPQFRGR